MKLKYITLVLSLLYSTGNLLGQTNYEQHLIFPLLTPECQSNLVVTATPEHSKPCTPENTNLLSNTNLFSPAEQQLLKEIPLKYKSVTTNSGPAGTVFKGLAVRQWKLQQELVKTFPVSCFVYTNFEAREEIAFMSSRTTIASFRTQFGDGYDVNLIDGELVQYQQYKNGVLDGLCIGGVFDVVHCGHWARFVKGKLLGNFYYWDREGNIIMDAEFKEPFDFLKYEMKKFDLAWTEAPTNTTNSAQNSP